MTAQPITCRYAGRKGRVAACGAFESEHHARAADLGLCCVDAAFRDLDLDQGDEELHTAPTSPDWPVFQPSDDDVPGGQW